jgi:hypothetical protein
MALDENELELLEGYLDDALDEREVEAVRARLAGGQGWIAALDQLRAEREMRQAMFAAIEPSPVEVERLVGQVQRGIERRRRFAGALRISRWISAAAACFVAGFLVHSAFFADRNAGPTNGTQSVQPVLNSGASVRSVEVYEVSLRDETGKVVAVQRFDSLAKAQEFANDVSQWQRRAERLAGGQFVVRAQRL